MSHEVRNRAEPRYHYPRRRRPTEQDEMPSLGGHGHQEETQIHQAEVHDHDQVGAPVYQPDKGEQRGQGVRDIISGVVLIGIGMAYGGSVFTGNPTAIDWFFDGLGIFWVGKGLYHIFS